MGHVRVSEHGPAESEHVQAVDARQREPEVWELARLIHDARVEGERVIDEDLDERDAGARSAHGWRDGLDR